MAGGLAGMRPHPPQPHSPCPRGRARMAPRAWRPSRARSHWGTASHSGALQRRSGRLRTWGAWDHLSPGMCELCVYWTPTPAPRCPPPPQPPHQDDDGAECRREGLFPRAWLGCRREGLLSRACLGCRREGLFPRACLGDASSSGQAPVLTSVASGPDSGRCEPGHSAQHAGPGGCKSGPPLVPPEGNPPTGEPPAHMGTAAAVNITPALSPACTQSVPLGIGAVLAEALRPERVFPGPWWKTPEQE